MLVFRRVQYLGVCYSDPWGPLFGSLPFIFSILNSYQAQRLFKKTILFLAVPGDGGAFNRLHPDLFHSNVFLLIYKIGKANHLNS